MTDQILRPDHLQSHTITEMFGQIEARGEGAGFYSMVLLQAITDAVKTLDANDPPDGPKERARAFLQLVLPEKA